MAFVCHRGLNHFWRMPIGLCNASQLFQRVIEVALKGLIGVSIMLRKDDIVSYSRSENEHIQHLEEVFQCLRYYNLTLNSSKCKVAVRMGAPKDLPEIRSFLGIANYYRSCIRYLAKISEPLVALTRKHACFRWTQEHRQAFDLLK